MSPRLSDALLRSQTDERLVALAGEGHERAFTTLVERHRRPLLAFARRLAGEDRGEDVVQQALMQAWTALEGGTEVKHVRGWLHEIVRRAAWRAVARVRDAQPLGDELVGGVDPAAAAEGREAFDELVARVADLPVRQREALLQMAVEGHSRDEVAGRLGVSTAAVRQLVHRARATLRTAATAITPWPLVAWAARGSTSGGLGDRVGELVAGAGSAGVAGALSKSAAVMVATGAVAGGVVVEHGRRAEDKVSRPAAVRSAEPTRAPAVVPARSTSPPPGSAVREDRSLSDGSGRGSRGRGGEEEGGSGSAHGNRGRGGDDRGSGSGGGGGSGSSGSGHEDDGGSGASGRSGSGDGSRAEDSGDGGEHGDRTNGAGDSSGSGSGRSDEGSPGSGSGSSGSHGGESEASGSGSGSSRSGGSASSGSSGPGSPPSGTSGSDSDSGSSGGSGSDDSGGSGSGGDEPDSD
jgi:RNA polymerase sigma factor (sigma-70 family)